MGASVLGKLREGFLSLKGSSKYMYFMFVIHTLDSFSYFAQSLMFTMFLTQKFGVSDSHAGAAYGTWGMLITVYNILLAPLVDYMGVRYSLLIGCFFAGFGKILMGFTTSREVLWICCYGLIPLGTGFTGTPMIIGIKRFTNPLGRGFAYGLYYSLMNVAALVNGMLFDVFRVRLVNGFKLDSFGEHSPLNDGLRLFLVIAGLLYVVCIGFSFFLDESEALDVEEGEIRSTALDEAEAPVTLSQAVTKQANKFREFGQGVKAIWSMTLVKYIIVCLITINLKQIFRHLDATLPKYVTRAFGCDAAVGVLYSINPFMIIFLVPVLQGALTSYNHYDVIHYGSYITGLSPFIMVFFQKQWATAVFVVLLSIGESIWSPRWYDYSMSIAPRSREAMFSALASAPLFLAKMPVGLLSGYLTGKFCPNNKACTPQPLPRDQWQPCRGKSIWLIIGLLTLSSPLCLTLGSWWLRSTGSVDKPKERDTASEAQPLLKHGEVEEASDK